MKNFFIKSIVVKTINTYIHKDSYKIIGISKFYNIDEAEKYIKEQIMQDEKNGFSVFEYHLEIEKVIIYKRKERKRK